MSKIINNSILMGKYIYSFLHDDEELRNLVGDNIFPLICDEDVKYPFIVYGRENLVPDYMKDGLCQDAVSFSFYIVSNNYLESLTIANCVRRILECKTYRDETINILQMRLDLITETFEEDAYIQHITISAICGN